MTLPIGVPVPTRNGWQPWKRFDSNITVGDRMLNQGFKEFIAS